MEDVSNIAAKFDLDMDEIRSGIVAEVHSAQHSEQQVQPLPPEDASSSAPTRRPSRSGVKYTEKGDDSVATPAVAATPAVKSSAGQQELGGSDAKAPKSMQGSPSSPGKVYITSFGDKITRAPGEEDAFFNKLYEQGKSKLKDQPADPEIVAEVLQKRNVPKKSASEQSDYMNRLYSKGQKAVKAKESDDDSSLSSPRSRPTGPRPQASQQALATNRLYERGRKAPAPTHSADAETVQAEKKVTVSARPARASDQGKAMQSLYERGRKAVSEPPPTEAEVSRRPRPKASEQTEAMQRLYGGGRVRKPKVDVAQAPPTADTEYVPPRHLTVDSPRVNKYGRTKQAKPKAVFDDPAHPALDPSSVYPYNMERFGAKSDGQGLSGYYEGSDAIVYEVHKRNLQDALEHSNRLLQDPPTGPVSPTKARSAAKPSGNGKPKGKSRKLKSPVKGAGAQKGDADDDFDADAGAFALDANVGTINDERDLSKMISRVLNKCDTALADSYNTVVVPRRQPGEKMTDSEALHHSRLNKALSSQAYNDAMEEALRNKDLNKLKVLLADRPMAIPLGTTRVDIASNAEFDSQFQAPQLTGRPPAHGQGLPVDPDGDLALRYKLAMSQGYGSLVPQSHVEALERNPIFKDTYNIKALLAPYVNKAYAEPEEVAQEVRGRMELEEEKDRAMSRRMRELRRGKKAGAAEGPSGLFLTAPEEIEESDADSQESGSGDSDVEPEKLRRKQKPGPENKRQQEIRDDYAPVEVPLSPGGGDLGDNGDHDEDEMSLSSTFPQPQPPSSVGAHLQQHFRKIVVSSASVNSLKKQKQKKHQHQLPPQRSGGEGGVDDYLSESEETERVIEVDHLPPAAKLIRRSLNGQIIPEESPRKKKKKRKKNHPDESEEESESSLRSKGKSKPKDATADVKAMVNDFYQGLARRQSRSDPVDDDDTGPATDSRGDKERGYKPRPSGPSQAPPPQQLQPPSAHPRHIPYSRNNKGALSEDPVRAAELARRREEKERERLSKIEFYALQRQMKLQREEEERAELLGNRQEARRVQRAGGKGTGKREQAPAPPQRSNPSKRPPGRPKAMPKPKPPAPKTRLAPAPKRPSYRQGRGRGPDAIAADLNQNLFMLFPPQMMAFAAPPAPAAPAAFSGEEMVSNGLPPGFPQPKMPLYHPPNQGQAQPHGQSPRRHQHAPEFDSLEPLQNIVAHPQWQAPQQQLSPKRQLENREQAQMEQPFQKLQDLYGAAVAQAQGQAQLGLVVPSSAPADPIQQPGMFAYGMNSGRHRSPPQSFDSPSKGLGHTQPQQQQEQSVGSSPARAAAPSHAPTGYVSKFQSPKLHEPAINTRMNAGVAEPSSFPDSYSFELFRPKEQQPQPPPRAAPVADAPTHIPVEPMRADSFRRYGNPMLQVQPQAVPYRRSKQTKEPLKSPYIAVQNRPAPNPAQSRYTAEDLLAEPIHEAI